MTVTVYYNCPYPNCNEEIDIEFDTGEHFCEIDECPYCGHKPTPKEQLNIYDKLSEDAMGAAIDNAEYWEER